MPEPYSNYKEYVYWKQKNYNRMMDRRKWLQLAGLGTGVSMLPSFGMAEQKQYYALVDGKTILFQGDSITDAGRNREAEGPNNARGLGGGYVYQIVSSLLKAKPDMDFQCYNRGKSGNKVFQLADRWQADCIDIKPDVLSILIGVNDYWHVLGGNYDGTLEIYTNDLKKLLSETLEKLPKVKLIIGEPFIVKGGKAIDERWYPGFADYQKAARDIAKEFNTGFVPYQAYFDKALNKAPVSYWCPDGVHPSIAGGALMADAWLNTFKKM